MKSAVEEYNGNVVINPTTIDTEKYHDRCTEHKNETLTIGWTGSHSTNRYLELIVPVLEKLKKEYDFNFVVISDEEPSMGNELFQYVPWRRKTEIIDLLQLNIGVMPLSHDPWSEGKCGFKALQYMSLGMPALVSPVGINEEIVDHGVNGYVCRTEDEWVNYLSILLKDRQMLKKMGEAARNKIVNQYSVRSNKTNFIHLFA